MLECCVPVVNCRVVYADRATVAHDERSGAQHGEGNRKTRKRGGEGEEEQQRGERKSQDRRKAEGSSCAIRHAIRNGDMKTRPKGTIPTHTPSSRRVRTHLKKVRGEEQETHAKYNSREQEPRHQPNPNLDLVRRCRGEQERVGGSGTIRVKGYECGHAERGRRTAPDEAERTGGSWNRWKSNRGMCQGLQTRGLETSRRQGAGLAGWRLA